MVKFNLKSYLMLVVALLVSNVFLAAFSSPSLSAAPTNPYNPLMYVPSSAPFRICDTRSGTLTECSGKTMTSGQTLPVSIVGQTSQSGLAVPSGAVSVVVNVTATNTTSTGYFTLFGMGAQMPAVSNLNWTGSGTTVANMSMIPLVSGGIDAYLFGGSADLIIDVEGWYLPISSSGGSLYNPISPQRVCDTRLGNSTPCSGHTLQNGQVLTVQVAGIGGVPSNASAVAINVTTINQSGWSYITVYPSGSSLPTVSNQNFQGNQIRPARVIATLSSSDPGHINIYYYGGSADVIVDLNGYYMNYSGTVDGSAYYDTPLSRIVDTRCKYVTASSLCESENLPAPNSNLGIFGSTNSTEQVNIVGDAEVPSFASAVVANFTIISSSTYGFVTAYPPSDTTLPVISDLNWNNEGQISANLGIVEIGSSGLFVNGINVYSYAATNLIIDVSGFFGQISPSSTSVELVTTTLPQAIPGVPYFAILSASGGVSTTYSWTATSLPNGLSICSSKGSSCSVSGVMTAGSYSFNVQVSDGFGNSPTFSITLVVGPIEFSTPQTIGNAPVVMNSVSCSSASFCVDGGALTSTWNGSSWSKPVGVDPQAGFTQVSCPVDGWCEAVDTSGQAINYSNSSWSSPSLIDKNPGVYGVVGVSCVTTTFCFAVDDNGQVIKFNGTWQTPVMIDLSGNSLGVGFESISCGSTSFCDAIDRDGNYFVFSGGSWTKGGYLDSTTSAISCSGTWCMATNTSGLSYAFNGSTWTGYSADPGFVLTGISCTASTSCIAVDVGGREVAFNGSSWSSPSTVDSDRYGLYSVSCVSNGFCAAVAHTTVELESGLWTVPQVVPGSESTFIAVSCPEVSWCLATTNSGQYVELNGINWSQPTVVEPPLLGFMDISCASTIFCVGVDNAGNELTWNGSSFSSPVLIDSHGTLNTVSCPVVNFCVAGDAEGYVSVESGGVFQSPLHIDVSGAGIDSVSCSSQTFCVAVDNDGNIFTFNGSTWSGPDAVDQNLGPGDLTGVSCSSQTFCVAVDFKDQAFIYNGSNWSGANSLGPSFVGLSAVSCSETNQCMVTNWIGQAISFEGAVFGTPTLIDPSAVGLPSVSCPSSDYCVVGDDVGNAILPE